MPADAPDSAVDPFAPAPLRRRRRRVPPSSIAWPAKASVSSYPLRMLRLDATVGRWSRSRRKSEVDRQRGGVLVDALFRDVTEQRRLKDRSRELYQQLLQAEKLAVLGQTISRVAHELNNPLATILSWAERLQEQPLDATSTRGAPTSSSPQPSAPPASSATC